MVCVCVCVCDDSMQIREIDGANGEGRNDSGNDSSGLCALKHVLVPFAWSLKCRTNRDAKLPKRPRRR